MKYKVISIAAIAVLLLGACAPQATPTTNPMDVQHTAEAAAFTMVAQTQAAIPTNTPVPPTPLASPTSLPTLTLVASPTPIGDTVIVNTPTGIPTLIPQQPTTASQSGTTVDNCNKPLTAWDGPTANFNVVNETRPEGTVVLSLYVVTALGECGYLADLSQGPVGMYSAGAFVDGRQSFKVFGGFSINEGNWDIVIRNDKIIAVGGCYPNC
jgi:hypothetical protein